MAISNYPSGFGGGALIKGIPLFDMIDGNVFWVDSVNGKAGNPGTFTQPLATIDSAIGKCTANNNDVIYAKAKHAETISSATSLVADVAGVTIVGLGHGSQRPKLTFSAAASSVVVSAADVQFHNMIWSANFADVADAVTLTAADLVLADIKFTNEGTNLNFVEIVDTDTTDNSADGLSFFRCHWFEVDTAATSMVNVDGDLDGLTIHDCYVDLGVNGVLSTLAEVAAGKDLTNVDIRRNYSSRLVTASAIQLITFVDTTTTNTGILEDNRCRSLDVLGELLITSGTNISQYNNLSTSAVTASGYLLPAADS